MKKLQRTKIAVLGSAFDPLHYGHAGIAVLALTEKIADEVWLVPCPTRWDKQPLYSSALRLKWAYIASKHLQTLGLHIKVSEEELLQPFRGSYTFLCHLRSKFIDCDFVFLMGSDSYANIHTWKDPLTQLHNGQKIVEEFDLGIIKRSDDSNTNLNLKANSTKNRFVLPDFNSQQTVLKKYLPKVLTEHLGIMSSSKIKSAIQNKDFSTIQNWTYPEIFEDLKQQSTEPSIKEVSKNV